MCIYICVEVVLINILTLQVAPPNKNSWLCPWIEERETRERRDKKLFKNNKKILFKWNGKKKYKFWYIWYYKVVCYML